VVASMVVIWVHSGTERRVLPAPLARWASMVADPLGELKLDGMKRNR
jgi:hypothetical protein